MSSEYIAPGEELDAEVARRVFGSRVEPVEQSWTMRDWNRSAPPTHIGGMGILPGPTASLRVGWSIPHYSESYEDMELLVDKLVADHWYMHIARAHLGDCPWWCSMFKSDSPKEQGEPDDEEYSAVGLTMPHALALCAIKAYKGEQR